MNDKRSERLSGRDFLKSQINNYKYGVISAEEFCKSMQDLGQYGWAILDHNFEKIVYTMIPAICKEHTESKSNDKPWRSAEESEKERKKERDLKFWIGLKDCDYLMGRGHTFTEEREEFFKTGKGRLEPVEYTDEYLAIEPEMERLIRAETGEGGWTGFCHTYWAVKKKVLKEHFGIDWLSIDDRFPGLLID